MTEKVSFKEIKERHMMATSARHTFGDMTSLFPDICLIYGEMKDFWIGKWVFEYRNFRDVKFPKETTRKLSPDDVINFKENRGVEIKFVDSSDSKLTPDQIIEEWLGGFNQHDVEKVVSLYAENATHFSPRLRDQHPETEGQIKGKPALRRWYEESFRNFPTLRYDKHRISIGDSYVFIEYVRSTNGQDKKHMMEVLEIKSGKIVLSKVFLG